MNRKKIVGIGLSLLVIMTALLGCGTAKTPITTGLPDYSDTELSLDISAWIAPKATDAAYADYSAAGYNTVHLMNTSVHIATANVNKEKVNNDLEANFILAEKYGIKVILALAAANLNSTSATPFAYADSLLGETLSKWKDSDTFYGYMAYDEPHLENSLTATGNYMQPTYDKIYDYIRDEYLYFSRNYPGKFFETVLLRAPNDGETMRYQRGSSKTYTDYLELYYSTIMKYIPVNERVYSMDAYCFTKDRDGKVLLRECYLDSLEKTSLMSEKYTAKKMSYTQNHCYVYNTASVLYNYYSALAYGFTDFVTYVYGYVNWDHDQGSIDMYGNKTDNYYYYQAAHEEIRSFENVYLNFTDNWKGVLAYLGSERDEGEKLPWKNCTALLESYPRISKVANTQDLIIGAMKDQNGYDGFLLSNQVNPSGNTQNNVSVTFNDADKAVIYVDGKDAQTVTLEKGTLEVVLESGAGAFVIPVKE